LGWVYLVQIRASGCGLDSFENSSLVSNDTVDCYIEKLVSCIFRVVNSSTLKTEAASSCEKLEPTYQSSYHIQEDCSLHQDRCENLKYLKGSFGSG
jgi:hypothetical protein